MTTDNLVSVEPASVTTVKTDIVAKREALAELAHLQWCGWMEYLFSKGIKNADGTWTMPIWAVERWVRQCKTPYSKLSPYEQESDRKEADKFLQAMSAFPTPSFAYSKALAFESLELREKFDRDQVVFNQVTFEDFEKYAKIIAYKVAHNLQNGFVMDVNNDPLNYGNPTDDAVNNH